MAIAANSYGSAAEVAALCRVYTNAGAFDTTTVPTLANVEGFIDQISAIANTALAAQGFKIPVSQPDAKRAIDSIVNQLSSDMTHAANSAGRFFSERALTGGLSVMASVRKDIYDWVSDNATGLTALGAERSFESQNTVVYSEANYASIFDREQYRGGP
jgi:hypothetical protein